MSRISKPSYETLLRRHFAPLYGSVLHQLGDEEDAAVVAQLLVLRLYREGCATPA